MARRVSFRCHCMCGDGGSEGEGCGLGLSIVARIAALSHAQLELGDGLPRADGGHGFAATLRFGEAAIPS